jgi:DNA-3-methyladenine glycosylase II
LGLGAKRKTGLIMGINYRRECMGGKRTNLKTIRTLADVRHGLSDLVEADPRLAQIATLAGELPLRLSTADYAGLAGIIVSQQVSRASAEAIHARLVRLVDPLDAPTLLSCEDTIFREAGLSRPKQRALISAAQAVAGGQLDFAVLGGMQADEAMATMTAVKGIGPWTAEVYLLFCSGHPDIFPAGDLALQEAVRAAFDLQQRPPDKELRDIALQWSPWRGVAARLFWAYYRVIKGGTDAMPL